MVVVMGIAMVIVDAIQDSGMAEGANSVKGILLLQVEESKSDSDWEHKNNQQCLTRTPSYMLLRCNYKGQTFRYSRG